MGSKDGITVTVYGLASSEDGKLRYIGQTTGALNKRLIHHHYDAKKLSTIHKSNWIRSVIARGHKIVIFPIEENAPWGSAEIRWIKHYRELGCDLVNTTDGGEGVVGYIRTPEQRAAHADRMRGRTSPRKGVKASDETKARISSAQKGKKISPETREKISAALKGRKKSAEHVAKVVEALRKPKPPLTDEEVAARKAEKFANLSARSKGKKLDSEHKAKISDGLARAYADGTRRGPKAKLSDEQVREIRALVREITANQKEIAERFCVSQAVISEIKTGKSYKHVK